MKTSFIRYIFLISFFGGATHLAVAQQDTTRLRKEVEVVKAYQPSISDAFKINDIPQIKQNAAEKPVFDYRINSKPVFSTFSVEPVQAAQMTREPKAEQGNGLLKGGIGNYKTPYAELFYNTEAGRRSAFGMHFKHLSSNGKIKLMNDDKVKAPHSENLAALYATHNFRKATLDAKLHFSKQAFRYYGYSGDSLTNARKEMLMPFWDFKQAFSKGGLEVQLTGDKNPRSDLFYKANFQYQHFSTKSGQKENLVKLSGLIDKEFDQFWGQLDAGLTVLKTDSIFNQAFGEYGKKQQLVLKLNPSVLFSTDEASLRIGLNSYSVMDDDTNGDYMLAPLVKAEWSPVENMLTLFAGTDGKIQHNHYSAIAAENQFINPYQDIKNTKYNYILTAGLRGKFSSKFNFRVQADYAKIKNQHFFILNEDKYLGAEDPFLKSNTFDVVYDRMKQLTLGGELFFVASKDFSLLVNSKFYSYDLNNLAEAWQKPGYEAGASLNFHPEGPLSLTADILLFGERKALVQTAIYDPVISNTEPVQTEETIFTIDPVLDINFGLNYQYSSKLSFWGQVNNFAFQKYESWLGYTQKGMTLLVGASYSF